MPMSPIRSPLPLTHGYFSKSHFKRTKRMEIEGKIKIIYSTKEVK